MKNDKIFYLITLTMVLAFTSCDVDQTQDTKMPDVDVDVESGQLPAFDIDWADVKVGTRTKMVSVPTVKVVMEEVEVEVPYVDVDMPNGGDKEELTIAVEADISGTSHSLEIQEVVATQKRLIVFSKLSSTGQDLKNETMRISDRIVLNASDDLDVKHYIIGKRLPGQFNKQYSYISNKNAIVRKLKNPKTIYKR